MKVFYHYLFDRRLFILIYVVSIVLCGIVFSLYDLPFESLMYCLILIVCFLVICISLDFYRYYKQHQTLVTLKQHCNVSLSSDIIDSSLKGEDYHDILVSMKEYHEQYEMDVQNQMKDLEDYFMMWVHQAKLPIAAMKLLVEEEDVSLSELKLQLLRMDQYTDMVLAYLRMHSEHTDFLFRELELDSLVQQAIRHFSTEFIRKHIQLDFKASQDVILSDEKWLVFVLEQVLSNALKYTSSYGKISIYEKEKHILVIEDTGMGIDSSDLHRIFEKGYTGINGRKDKSASGLGLYLCKNIMDTLNHKIWIESAVEKGTLVYLDLTHYGGMVE